MLNQVQLIGHLGADPDIRSTQGGEKVASLRLATSERWTDRASGEKKERTEWHSVVVFGGLVDVIEQFVKKGSKIFVQGQLRTRKWVHSDGADRYSTEVVLSGFGSTLHMLDGAQGAGPGRNDYSSYEGGPGAGGAGGAADAGGAVGAGGGAGSGGHELGDDHVPF